MYSGIKEGAGMDEKIFQALVVWGREERRCDDFLDPILPLRNPTE